MGFFHINRRYGQYNSSLQKLFKKSIFSQKQLAAKLGICERTLRYYLKGDRLPKPEHLILLAQAFNQTERKLYPEYFIEFMSNNKRRRGDWCNQICQQLIQKGWGTKLMARNCKMNIFMVYQLLAWRYPPREKTLLRLEEGFESTRNIFWPEWQKQQQQFYKEKKRRYL